MAKVLFINPIMREEDEPRHVPYGLALLAAIAMKAGHLVQVFDANAWRAGDEVLREVLQADEWDCVMTGGITTAYSSIKKICAASKEVIPSALLVVGGGVLTSMPYDIMKFIPQIDIGVIGEGFITNTEILGKLDRKESDWENVDGLMWRDKDGELKLTKNRELLHDIDTLPYPAWELFPLEEVYFKNSMALFSEEGMTAKRRIDVAGSYGCSLVCRYCFHLGIIGDMEYKEDEEGKQDVAFGYKRSLRWHSPRYIVDMVKYARDKFGVDFVGFHDENLMTMDQASKRTWMTEICRLWIEAGLQPQCIRDGVPHTEECKGVHWGGTSHANLVTKKALAEMRQAGCSHLVYGYESFSPRVMRTIGKGSTPELNERSYYWTLESGIRPIPNQMFGFPEEDFDSIRDMMRAFDRMGIQARPHIVTPYPGSEWYTVYKDSIIEQYNGDLEAFLIDLGDATRVTAVISHKFNAIELYGIREIIVNRDYKRLDEYERQWNKLRGIETPAKPAEDEKKASAPVAARPAVSAVPG